MTQRWIRAAAAGAVLAALAVGYFLGAARADGTPTTEPLAYAGTLMNGAVPATGSPMIGVSLWMDATSTAMAMRACDTPAATRTLTSGRFRVVLDPTCVAAVHAHADLWVELTVDGTTLGPRSHLGAVPYALEAARLVRTDASWCGLSTSMHTGTIMSGPSTGYLGAGAICRTTCSSTTAHMCTASELAINAQIEPNPYRGGPASAAWYATALSPIGGTTRTDCVGWTNATGSNFGSVWTIATDHAGDDVCTAAHPVICCD